MCNLNKRLGLPDGKKRERGQLMAYFPNGTAGEYLTEQCNNCLHGIKDDIVCPVAVVQMSYNYDQLDEGNEALQEAMNELIDENGDCQMKKAIEDAGISIDLSGRDQMELL